MTGRDSRRARVLGPCAPGVFLVLALGACGGEPGRSSGFASDGVETNGDDTAEESAEGASTETSETAGEGTESGETEDGGVPDMGDDSGETETGEQDPCLDRPPLALTSQFDVLYGNANPTSETFVGTTQWADAFGMEFPQDTGAAKRIRTERDHYAVIAFDTFDVEESGGLLQSENPQITNTTGLKLVSISECPGDFAEPLDDPDCRKRLGPSGSLRWSFDDGLGECQLERDREYFLNIVFTEQEEPPITWACTIVPDAESCMMLFATYPG